MKVKKQTIEIGETAAYLYNVGRSLHIYNLGQSSHIYTM